MDVKKKVKLFVGLTSSDLLRDERGYKELINNVTIQKKYQIPVEQIYINPLLGTSKV